MSDDIMPNADADLGPWGHKLLAGCTAHATALGLTPAEVTDLSDNLDDWDADYPAHLTAAAAAASACATKNSTRAALEAKVRAINTKIQANPAINADLKTELGLPVHDNIRTRAPVPTTRPLLVVDTSERLRHKITYRDESTPTTRAKPAGVREIEIWAKIGPPPPVDASECQLLGTSTKSSLVITHQGADAGKPVHYLGRWKNTRGEFGPWSETVVATIGA